MIAVGEARGRLEGLRAAILTVDELSPGTLSAELRAELETAGLDRLQMILKEVVKPRSGPGGLARRGCSTQGARDGVRTR